MGGGHQEVELKLQVEGEKALQAIITAAKGKAAAPVQQVNHFFDTSDKRFRAGFFVLRLRDEGGRWFLTGKGPQKRSESSALTSQDELEVEVDAKTATAILAGRSSALDLLEERTRGQAAELIADLRKAAAGARLVEIGAFENTRTRVSAALPAEGKAIDATLELDRTVFPGPQVDCEIEMEVPAGTDPALAERALLGLLARAGVHGKPAASKSKRFFKALEGNKA